MKRFLSKWGYPGKALLAAAFVLVCAAVLAAILKDGTEVEYDQARHDELLDLQIKSLDDLVDDYLFYQSEFLRIAPPNAPAPLIQSGGVLPLLDQTKFPESFIDGLLGYDNDGIERFPIRVYEDGNSYGREIVVENMLGKEIARLKRAYDYSPDWFVREQYPDFDTYPQADREWLLANYDPARIVIDYELILDEKNLIRLVWQETILAAVKPDPGGGMMMMDWEGGPVTNLQFVDIEWPTNHTGVLVTLAYPEEIQTNASTVFEIFTCENLLDPWWDPATTIDVDTDTNWVEWLDTSATNMADGPRFYAAAVEDDQDGDGYTDGEEIYVFQTDPENSNEYPVSVSGTISYSGPQEGNIRMIAVGNSNDWLGCPIEIAEPGAYTNHKVAVDSNYWFKAWRDSDADNEFDSSEAYGMYTTTATYVTTDLTGIDILLADPDYDGDGLSDWWEMEYLGTLAYGAADDVDGDGLSNSQEFSGDTDPSLMDTDGDGVNDAADDDPDGTADDDGDGLPDGWENYWGGTNWFDAGTSNWDGDAWTDTEEWQLGTCPTNANVSDAGNMTDLTVFTPTE